jgi:hypothetical protein
LQGLRADRLKESHPSRLLEPGRIHEHQHIGRALGAFLAQTLNEGIILALQQLHADAGAGGELLVKSLVAVVVAAGVDADFRSLGLGEPPHQGHHGCRSEEAETNQERGGQGRWGSGHSGLRTAGEARCSPG